MADDQLNGLLDDEGQRLRDAGVRVTLGDPDVVFSMLILVGAIKMSDRISKEMLGL